MNKRKIIKMRRLKQAGFTMIEVMVALAITAAIALGAAGVIKALWGTNYDSQAMSASNNIENAISWINPDVMASQFVSANMTPAFQITMDRENWDGTSYQILYSLNGNQLVRSVSVNGTAPTDSIVAREIDTDPVSTNCSADNGVLNLKLSSEVGSVTETKNYQIKIRPDVPQLLN